jgi:hypothetical protein
MGWLGRRKEPEKQETNPYIGLRNQALTIDPASIGLAPSPEHPNLLAGLMEMGMGGGIATLVIIADGTTSMYWSTGGGIIGAGFHEPVKAPSRRFLALLERHLPDLSPDDPGHQLPEEGMIHIRARTFAGASLFGAAQEEDFKAKRHPLWDVFYAGHDVITVMRQLPPVQSSTGSR